MKYSHNVNLCKEQMNVIASLYILYTGMLAGGILGGLLLVCVCWCVSFCICMKVSICPLHKIYYKRTVRNLEEASPMQEHAQTQAEETQAEETHAEETTF